MNVCDSTALATPGILIEFFISALQEGLGGTGTRMSQYVCVSFKYSKSEICRGGVPGDSECVFTVYTIPCLCFIQ